MLILPDTIKKKPYLAVSVSYKADLANLVEFLEYHRLVGVQRIYLCNNEENPYPTNCILKPYHKEGYVQSYHTAAMWPGSRNRQAAAHEFIAHIARRDGVKWLAMLDMDEFIFPIMTDTVPELLNQYEDITCLQASYCCFGSSNHYFKQKLQTDSYNCRSDEAWAWNQLTKSIAQVEFIGKCDFHHHFRMVRGGWVDEDKKPCDFYFRPKWKYIRINHYMARSTQDFEEKIKRGNPLGEKRDWNWFKSVDRNEIYDDSMQRFVPKLWKLLKNNPNWYTSKGIAKFI